MNKSNVPPPVGPPPSYPTANYPPPPIQVVTVLALGPDSARTVCPHCRNEILTDTRKVNSTMAWVSGFLIAFFGCFCGCCLIPCCLDSCKNTHHYCPRCGAYLGLYSK